MVRDHVTVTCVHITCCNNRVWLYIISTNTKMFKNPKWITFWTFRIVQPAACSSQCCIDYHQRAQCFQKINNDPNKRILGNDLPWDLRSLSVSDQNTIVILRRFGIPGYWKSQDLLFQLYPGTIVEIWSGLKVDRENHHRRLWVETNLKWSLFA